MSDEPPANATPDRPLPWEEWAEAGHLLAVFEPSEREHRATFRSSRRWEL